MNVIESFSLKGRVVLVTGGAGLYGRQIVAALAEAGAATIIASRNTEALEKLSESERARGLDVTAMSLDLAKTDSILGLCDAVYERAGRPDVLVNNAVTRPMKDWSDPIDGWRTSMEVNGTGLFTITRAFGDRMAKAGRGSIINIGSIASMVAPEFWLYENWDWTPPPDYFFHKGGMHAFTRFVAALYGPKGVRCNVISPGGLFADQEKEFHHRYCQRTFLGRMANDTDLKGAVVYLASDASAYVTGANLVIDGGTTAK